MELYPVSVGLAPFVLSQPERRYVISSCHLSNLLTINDLVGFHVATFGEVRYFGCSWDNQILIKLMT